MRFKVFIQAQRIQAAADGNAEEKMFVYEIEADDQQAAMAEAKARFEFEDAAKGWQAHAAGAMPI